MEEKSAYWLKTIGHWQTSDSFHCSGQGSNFTALRETIRAVLYIEPVSPTDKIYVEGGTNTR